MAAADMVSLMGKYVPAFVVATTLMVTQDNVTDGWKESLNLDALKLALDAAK